MELGQHQEFILEFSELQCAHFKKHFFYRFKAEVLEHLRHFSQVFLDPLFFPLIYDSRHYVRKYAKLIEKSHFDPKVERLRYLALFKLKNECYSFE